MAVEIGNTFKKPAYLTSHWWQENTLFRVLSEASAGVKFRSGELPFKSFDLLMHLNRYGDLLLNRSDASRETQIFIENWLNIPARIDEVKKEAQSHGYKDKTEELIYKWLYLNRALNYASKKIFENDTPIPWEKYITEDDKQKISDNELKIIEEVKKIFSKLDTGNIDKKEASLLFRSISSFGFIFCLASIAQKEDILLPEDKQKFKKLGSMLMIAQLLDDISSPAKDVKQHILGMAIGSFSDKTILDKEQLIIHKDDAKDLVNRSNHIMKNCLDYFGVEPGSASRFMVKIGLVVMAGLSVNLNSKKYGGSRYPLIDTALYTLKELIGDNNTNGNNDMQNTMEEVMSSVYKMYN